MKNVISKSYYKIKEVAEIIGVPQSTLRHWENEFPELAPKRNEGNRRYYSRNDVELLQIIHYLLHIKGLKTEAAKEYLKHNRKNVSKKLKIVEQLKSVREDLEVFMSSLNLREQKIRGNNS